MIDDLVDGLIKEYLQRHLKVAIVVDSYYDDTDSGVEIEVKLILEKEVISQASGRAILILGEEE